MKPRLKPLGDKNLVGANVTKIRKLNHMSQKELATSMQLLGCDINYTSLSKLEGQLRSATDKEIFVISKIFDITTDDLFKRL
jgi:transcriptional regulator with XRE-family HTH domain